MKTRNEYLQLGGTLFAITAVVALLLGFFNNLTAPIIAETAAENKRLSMIEVMPAAETFRPIEAELPEDSVITEVQGGFDASGNLVGYCMSLSPKGYGGVVSLMVGLDTTPAVTGVNILTHAETPGLGAEADNASWLSQFVGKSGHLSVTKNATQSNQIQAVTSATITSTAITNAVNEAISFATTLKEVQ